MMDILSSEHLKGISWSPMGGGTRQYKVKKVMFNFMKETDRKLKI